MDNKKKPELLVTAKNLDELLQLVHSGADAINIGGEKYGLRVAGDFSLEMIQKGVEIAHENQVKIYVSINAILHNDDLEGLEEYVRQLAAAQVDAIVFGDPAVLVTAKAVAPQLPLHWNTETTSTNFETIEYWARKGASRAILARELSLEEVIDIKQRVDVEVQAQVHGMTCIFHSKRELVSSYLLHIDEEKKEQDTSKEKNLFLREHKRPDEKYPVFEDRHGTHVMSVHDICMIDHLGAFIEAGIDSLKIEGMLHDTEYVVQVTKLYRKAIDAILNEEASDGLFAQVEKIQPKNRSLDTGFYYKELFY